MNPLALQVDERDEADDIVSPEIVFGSGDSFLAAARGGEHIRFEHTAQPELPGQLAHTLQGTGVGVAIGALSFRHDGPAIFHLPHQARRLNAEQLRSRLRAPGVRTPFTDVSASPSPGAYARLVAAVTESIAEDPELHKVVLGRWIDVLAERDLAPAKVLCDLAMRHRGAQLFSIPLTGHEPGPVLVGASPELLISRRGRRIRSLPLAGSIPRSPDHREDRRRRTALERSVKDLAEHAFVVESLRQALRPLCAQLQIDARPHLVATDTMWHLGTGITGVLAGEEPPCALRLAQLCHPTPAVCGTPAGRAAEVIAAVERRDRGYLAGACGWVDARGDGDFAVTIRAGVIDGARISLFAGAGIVAGSDPELEARETEAKLGTMLSALGLAEEDPR